MLDVTDPANPRELEPLGPRSAYRNAQIVGDTLYRRWGRYVEIFDRLNSDQLIHSFYPGNFDVWRLVLRDEILYVLGRSDHNERKPGAPKDHRYRLQAFRVEELPQYRFAYLDRVHLIIQCEWAPREISCASIFSS